MKRTSIEKIKKNKTEQGTHFMIVNAAIFRSFTIPIFVLSKEQAVGLVAASIVVQCRAST